MLLVYRPRCATILCQKIPESESHEWWRCACVMILVLLHRVFLSFARYRKDSVSLLWISPYVMESYPCSVPPTQAKFLARNLSSLTRWRFCLYELVLAAADGAGFLVRCCSISFTRSPSAKSCFYKQVNFKRWSTGSFYFDYFDSRVLSIGAKIE